MVSLSLLVCTNASGMQKKKHQVPFAYHYSLLKILLARMVVVDEITDVYL